MGDKVASQVVEKEEEFQSWVIDLAHTRGWLVAHFRTARTKTGWRTAVSADGQGFPDLICSRGTITIYAEVKRQKGRLTPEQKLWLELLAQNPGNKCFVWRPSERKEIEEVLS
ncbi:MAG: VRR-NUC domain-containing protein [Dehalococcoidales bacterium]|nr:VRR-NUC domain-containing protein [Dehalococcoidales bacterium]